MRTSYVLLSGLALGGCFDEGGDTQRTAAANTVVDSLIAFSDIQANLTTDPVKAADALVKFVRTPVAANNLIAQPFDLAGATPVKRVASLGVPDCLTTSGPVGCDGFVTNAQCEAGDFTFTGNASRTCPDGPDPNSACDDVLGRCTYNWNLDLGYTTSSFALHMTTTGPVTVAKDDIQADVSFNFTLVNGTNTVAGNLRVCSCGAITVDAGPPRMVVNSSFVVKDNVAPQRCALVVFDAQGAMSSSSACICADSTTCL